MQTLKCKEEERISNSQSALSNKTSERILKTLASKVDNQTDLPEVGFSLTKNKTGEAELEQYY
ncbi:MAG: hypothetical protein H6581_26165 [Bacteroidia bacterium]|nr:hypothetical protein [Bacteroidia bacterium]